MCQSLSEGGKRCARHMNGSRAAFKEAKVRTGAEEGLLSKVFRHLRGEAKEEQAPTPEEVREFADKKRMQARFDPSLDKRSRNTLIRNWREARSENPDAGVFNAWKNMTAETKRVMTRRAAAFMAAGSILAVGACGTTGNNDTPEPPTSPSVEQTTPTRDFYEGEISFTLPDGLSEGEISSDSHGEYKELMLSPDADVATFDASKVAEGSVALDYYSEEELAEGQRVFSTFVVEEVADSPLLYDFSEERAEQWFESNSDIFTNDSETRESFKNNLLTTSERGIVVDSSGGWNRATPIYDGGVRHGNFEASLESISSPMEGYDGIVQFDYQLSYDNPVYDPAASDSNTYVEQNRIEYSLTGGQSPSTGKWEIIGISGVHDTALRPMN